MSATIETPSVEEIRSDARENLLLYSQLCDHRYKPGRMHKFIADRLTECANGKRKRIILNTPPQHGKSRACAVEFPTWLLGRNPELRIAVTSYGQHLCDKSSRQARNRVETADFKFLFPNFAPEPSHWTVSDWGTTAGGNYKAVGVGGSLTGFSVDCLIIDDAHKDEKEARSITMRDAVWDWFLTVAMTRLSPNAIIVLIGTRWHPDDICGRLLDPNRLEQMKDMGFESELYDHYNLKAISRDKDILGRKPSEALWPERYSLRWLRAQMAILGSFKSGAMYEGEPVVKGGNYIKPEDFVIVRKEDVPVSQQWMRYWDLAVTDKEMSDYTASPKGFIDANGNFWISDMVRGQWAWPIAKRRIVQTAQAERILIGVEEVGVGVGLVDEIRGSIDTEAPDTVVRGYNADSDKLTRALPWIAHTERKKVFLVQGEWIPAFINECEEFGPGCTHDDQIDGVSGLWKMLHESRGSSITSVKNHREPGRFSPSRSRVLI